MASVKRQIVGFHQDEYDDWVADLQCGHSQHVRHQPPWQNRPWVETTEGRRNHLGTSLFCKKCTVTCATTCATTTDETTSSKDTENNNNLL